MKKQETKQESNLQTQKDIMGRLAFEFDLKGSKLLSLLENDGEISFLDTGISGKAVVNLILGLATEYNSFFRYALEILKEFEDDMEESKNVSIN